MYFALISFLSLPSFFQFFVSLPNFSFLPLLLCPHHSSVKAVVSHATLLPSLRSTKESFRNCVDICFFEHPCESYPVLFCGLILACPPHTSGCDHRAPCPVRSANTQCMTLILHTVSCDVCTGPKHKRWWSLHTLGFACPLYTGDCNHCTLQPVSLFAFPPDGFWKPPMGAWLLCYWGPSSVGHHPVFCTKSRSE